MKSFLLDFTIKLLLKILQQLRLIGLSNFTYKIVCVKYKNYWPNLVFQMLVSFNTLFLSDWIGFIFLY